ncbi:Sec-independent protein translocase protein TatB [Phreatobacter sp.]|uniref:Sec-independent protein translocase protein TatB n=1 Tax=Phreatobacter sp. TaxID=1966341 RepID=UPI003F6EE0B8
MFDFSWSEIALVGIVALLVIGPKELPGVLRGMGQALAKLRSMASDFQYQFNQALQEAEVDKVKSSIDSVSDSVSKSASFDPIDFARDKIQSTVDEVKGALNPADPAAGTIGPPAPDAVAQAIPAPPGYTVDPASIQNQLAAPPAADKPLPLSGAASEPPAAFQAAVSGDTGQADKPADEPAEPPAKPRRSRKAAAEAPEPEPGAGTADAPVEDAAPKKRARKAKE